ncbi:prostatic spermine-binding protein-like [Mercenaria mercenaria]|uniref:prostatic spermine-binding protein-like n=1 Tax=Mercenaria mercenaria TaxID=6596 RepID=UPI00234ED451|nr:prostatic spermine-binding protein-like [Mercenaria mercenaria]
MIFILVVVTQITIVILTIIGCNGECDDDDDDDDDVSYVNNDSNGYLSWISKGRLLFLLRTDFYNTFISLSNVDDDDDDNDDDEEVEEGEDYDDAGEYNESNHNQGYTHSPMIFPFRVFVSRIVGDGENSNGYRDDVCGGDGENVDNVSLNDNKLDVSDDVIVMMKMQNTQSDGEGTFDGGECDANCDDDTIGDDDGGGGGYGNG